MSRVYLSATGLSDPVVTRFSGFWHTPRTTLSHLVGAPSSPAADPIAGFQPPTLSLFPWPLPPTTPVDVLATLLPPRPSPSPFPYRHPTALISALMLSASTIFVPPHWVMPDGLSAILLNSSTFRTRTNKKVDCKLSVGNQLLSFILYLVPDHYFCFFLYYYENFYPSRTQNSLY